MIDVPKQEVEEVKLGKRNSRDQEEGQIVDEEEKEESVQVGEDQKMREEGDTFEEPQTPKRQKISENAEQVVLKEA